MTENCQSDGDYLVEVQAQVMTRDDSTQCWVPMGGGGLSTVKLCKLSSAAGSDHTEYVIHGERIADKSVVLDCVLKKDIQYTKANPKFHHWNTDEKRFGLTFERSDDAKAFDHGIQNAVAELSEGFAGNNCREGGDETIFQIVDLPLGRKNSSSQSASTTSTTTSSPSPHSPSSVLPPGTHSDPFSFSHPHANHHHLHRVHYISASRHKLAGGGGVGGSRGDRDKDGGGSPSSEKSSPRKSDSIESWSGGGDDVWVRSDEPTSLSGKSDTGLLDGDGHHGLKEEPYVIFAKNKAGAPHEYSYPSLEPVHKPPAKRESTSTKKQPIVTQPYPPLPIKAKSKKHKSEQSRRLVPQRARCKHCRVMFNMEENHRGSCDSAPDTMARCIECVTCVSCTKCLIYHCMSDADGEYRHPCECDPNDDSNCKKWTALTILSFFIPCLWCYLPLHACHKCATACGICGGRHKAA